MKFLLVIATIVCILLLSGINKKQVPQTYEEWQRQHGQKTAHKVSPSKSKKQSSYTISYKKVFKSKPVPQSYEEWESVHEKKYMHKKEITFTFEGQKKQKKVPQTYEEWALKHPFSEEGSLKKTFIKN